MIPTTAIIDALATVDELHTLVFTIEYAADARQRERLKQNASEIADAFRTRMLTLDGPDDVEQQEIKQAALPF